MSFRLSSKLNVIVLILLLSIGFAAVATNLIINGNARISSNPVDFDVYFVKASTNPGGYANIVDDEHAIEWNSHMLTNPGEIAYLDYTVYNNSVNYDANVLIALNIEDVVNHVDYSGYYTIRTTTFDSTGYTLVRGKEAVDGKIEVELIKPVPEDVSINFTMTMNSSSIERDATVGPATSPCRVLTGNGHDFGDEIECAGEEFYLLSDESTELRMLSKYNLLAGYVYDTIEVTQERFDELVNLYGSTGDSTYIENEILTENEFSFYKWLYDEYGGTVYVNKVINNNSFILDIQLPTDNAHQNALAVGAHGDELGNPDAQQIGVFSDSSARCRSSISFESDEEYNNYFYGGGNFCDVEPLYPSVNNAYKEYLENHNVIVNNIDSMSLKELSEIISRFSGNRVWLEDWFDNKTRIDLGSNDDVIILSDLKELLPNKYAWLYSTTYWTKTGMNGNKGYGDYTVFIDTLGYVCSKYGCQRAIGAGVRPIVTISDYNVDFSTAPEEYIPK
jgi:hypothetical protein